MYQTTVTIGRNIGTEMMRARDWSMFATSVAAALRPISDDRNVEIHTGTGSWTDAEGVTTYEDSMHLTVRHAYSLDATVTGVLSGILASLATTYGQDAIALATGPVILVKPSRY